MRRIVILFGLVTAFDVASSAWAEDRDALVLPALGVVQAGGKQQAAPAAPPVVQYEEYRYRREPRRLQFSGGGGVYIMQPIFETNPAFGTSTTVFGPPTVFGRTQQDFGQDFDVAPTGWLGLALEDGLGLKTRYFQYAQGTGFSFLTPNPPAGGLSLIYTPYSEGVGITNVNTFVDDRYDFFSDLRITSWDVEVTRTWFGDSWQLQAAAGARLAYVSQDYSARFTPGPNNAIAGVSTMQTGHNFSGAGPLVAFDGYLDIGETGLAVFCSTRNSILFGRARNSATRNAFDPAGVLAATDNVDRQENDILPSSEIEFGVEFGRRFNRARFYTQIGMVGQMWWGAGNATNSDTITGTSFPDESTNSSVNLGMLGFLVRAGLDF